MIPKVIHCFWAGGPKTRLAETCLASWRRLAPEYEIREWKLSDVADLPQLPDFCAEAVRRRRWAFVSDWMRFHVLHAHGGVYFDLDVELVQPIAKLPEGEWIAGEWTADGTVVMNPGSGMALEKGNAVAAAMLRHYETAAFDDSLTVGSVLSGLKTGDLRMLRPEVLSPIGTNGKMHRTAETVGIHWYAMSWCGGRRRLARWLCWHGFEKLVRFLVAR